MKYILSLLLFVSYSIQSNKPHKKTYYEWKPDQFHKERIIEADSVQIVAKGRVNLWNNGRIVGNVDSFCLSIKTIQ
jgi:hypothetical protein